MGPVVWFVAGIGQYHGGYAGAVLHRRSELFPLSEVEGGAGLEDHGGGRGV